MPKSMKKGRRLLSSAHRESMKCQGEKASSTVPSAAGNLPSGLRLKKKSGKVSIPNIRETNLALKIFSPITLTTGTVRYASNTF